MLTSIQRLDNQTKASIAVAITTLSVALYAMLIVDFMRGSNEPLMGQTLTGNWAMFLVGFPFLIGTGVMLSVLYLYRMIVDEHPNNTQAQLSSDQESINA